MRNPELDTASIVQFLETGQHFGFLHVCLIGSMTEESASSKKKEATFSFLHVTVQLVFSESVQAKPAMQDYNFEGSTTSRQVAVSQKVADLVSKAHPLVQKPADLDPESCRKVASEARLDADPSPELRSMTISAETIDEEVDIGTAWAMRNPDSVRLDMRHTNDAVRFTNTSDKECHACEVFGRGWLFKAFLHLSQLQLVNARDVCRARQNGYQMSYLQNQVSKGLLPGLEVVDAFLKAFGGTLFIKGDAAYDAVDMLRDFFNRYMSH